MRVTIKNETIKNKGGRQKRGKLVNKKNNENGKSKKQKFVFGGNRTGTKFRKHKICDYLAKVWNEPEELWRGILDA